MSFEGIVHKICENGHHRCFDAMNEMYLEPQMKCDCGCKFVWEHVEDETNGYNEADPMNNGEFNKFRKQYEMYEACDVICKRTGQKVGEIQKYLVADALFNIPTTFGHKIDVHKCKQD